MRLKKLPEAYGSFGETKNSKVIEASIGSRKFLEISKYLREVNESAGN